MKKYPIPLYLALAGGAVGFGLRKWQLSTGFEPDTGLAIPGAPAALALVGWSVLMAAVLALLCRKMQAPETLEAAFHAQGNTLFAVAVILAGFLLLVSAGAEWAVYSATYRSGAGEPWMVRITSAFLPPLRMVLGALGTLCAILWAKDLFRGEGRGRESLSLLELCLFFCVWLISDYQERAADPVTMDFLYEVFAIVCGVMALYYIAGWSFQNGKTRRTAVLCLLGVYFSLTTLADRHSLAEMTRYGFLILFLSAHAALLLVPHTEEDAPTKEETEETPHE